MTPVPTARLFPTATGIDLVLSRTFRAPVTDVWASVTESERTARWFGPWEGEAGPGRTIKVQMAYEDDPIWCEMHIVECEPPRRLAISMTDENGDWRLDLNLSEVDNATELQLVQHLQSTDLVPDIGPGWEFYLDMLVAAREDKPRPDFEDYYAAMKPFFERLSTME